MIIDFLHLSISLYLSLSMPVKPQNDFPSSRVACLSHRRIQLCLVLVPLKKNPTKIFADRPKHVLNAPSQGEFKIKIKTIMRIND